MNLGNMASQLTAAKTASVTKSAPRTYSVMHPVSVPALIMLKADVVTDVKKINMIDKEDALIVQIVTI